MAKRHVNFVTLGNIQVLDQGRARIVTLGNIQLEVRERARIVQRVNFKMNKVKFRVNYALKAAI